MEYFSKMKTCTIHYYKSLKDINTPANIECKCKYEMERLCTYSEDCDFMSILTTKEAEELNVLHTDNRG